MKYSKTTCSLFLAGYTLVLLCKTVLFRASKDVSGIYRIVHWKHYKSVAAFSAPDVIGNILIFIPIGMLVGFISTKYRLVKAVFAGLFLSETIECSQLIWKKGAFDVDDLFNNTVGAAIGGIIVTSIMWIRGK